MKKFIGKAIVAVAVVAAPFIALSAGVASAEKAADNYNLYCVQCHGSKGTGKGINAPYLAVAPRNHTDPKAMGELSDANVAKAIKEGGVSVGKSSQMPPFGGILSDDEVNGLVKHLRGMCKCEGKK